MRAVARGHAFGDQQCRTGDRRRRRGDADRLEAFVRAVAAQPDGDVDLAGATDRNAVLESVVCHPRQILKADADGGRGAIALDHGERFGVARKGIGQIGALRILDRADVDADERERRAPVVIEQLPGNEIAPIRDHGEAVVRPGKADAAQPAEGIGLALEHEPTAINQALRAFADVGIGKAGQLHGVDDGAFRHGRSGEPGHGQNRGNQPAHQRRDRRAGPAGFSSNSAASSSVRAPASSSASSRVTARR